jgi:hypothetical protein
LIVGNQTAQDTAANRAAISGVVEVSIVHFTTNIKLCLTKIYQANGSDNHLLTGFMLPALGCKPFSAPNLADPGSDVSALALDVSALFTCCLSVCGL